MKIKDIKQMLKVNHKYKDKKGYVLVYCPEHPNKNHNGFVQEHRLIMELSINRFLEKAELVHHINRKKEDNRIENLQIVNAKEHKRLHREESLPSMTKAWKRSAEIRRKKPIRDNLFACNRCHKLLAKDLFVVRNNKPNGIGYNCKECHNIFYKGGVKQNVAS